MSIVLGNQGFSDYVCVGDSISYTHAESKTEFKVELCFDDTTAITDFDCYEEGNIDRFNAGEWFFAGLVVSANRDKWERKDIHSVWGYECNIAKDNEYLNSEAVNLIEEAIQILAAEEQE